MPFIPIIVKDIPGRVDSILIKRNLPPYGWCVCCRGVPLSYVYQKEFILETEGTRYRFIKDVNEQQEKILTDSVEKFKCRPAFRNVYKDDSASLIQACVIEWDEKRCWYKHGPNSYFAQKEKKELSDEKVALLLKRLIPYAALHSPTLVLLASYKRS